MGHACHDPGTMLPCSVGTHGGGVPGVVNRKGAQSDGRSWQGFVLREPGWGHGLGPWQRSSWSRAWSGALKCE